MDKNQRRLAKLKKLKTDSELAIFDAINELEDKLDKSIGEIKSSIPDLDDVLSSVKGKDGNEGIQGIQGEKGEPGTKGDNGTDGKDGRNGIDGKNGKDGRDGRDGRDGIDGIDGKNGDIKDLSSEEIRDSLELLKNDERLDISAIKGLDKNNKDLTDAIINRAIGILDSRTSFLINKVNNLASRSSGGGTGQVNSIVAGTGISVNSTDPANPIVSATGSSSGYQIPLTGALNQATFTWTTAPNAIVVDQGRVMQKVSTDGTINWTGTTTTVLTVFPTFDIFSVA